RAVGAFLVVGALPWMAFCDTVSRAMNSLLDVGSLLQRSPLPAVLFPVRSALASAVIYAPIMIGLMAAYAPFHRFSPSLVAFLLLLAFQFILSVVLGYLLAVFAAAMRDTVQVVGFLLSVGIFLSPVLFPISMFPEKWRWVLWLNPMSAPVAGYQAILLQGEWPSLSVWVVTGIWIALLVVALSLVVQRCQDQLVDWL
ncbi:MAG: ABC transporter permease, partial [Ramlibacter sp.]